MRNYKSWLSFLTKYAVVLLRLHEELSFKINSEALKRNVKQ